MHDIKKCISTQKVTSTLMPVKIGLASDLSMAVTTLNSIMSYTAATKMPVGVIFTATLVISRI